MPIVLQSVIVIDITEPPPTRATVRSRCDGCSRQLDRVARGLLVRNRHGPAAVRAVWLCADCRHALDRLSDPRSDR